MIISRAQLSGAMHEFVQKNCTKLPVDEREKLAAASVHAQEEYTVAHCHNFLENADYTSGLPMTGTWVIRNILERRDLIIVW